MQKTIMPRPASPKANSVANDPWLPLPDLAEVELSSENPNRPIEDALTPAGSQNTGWQAGDPGPQTIRLHFTTPQDLRHIQLRFDVPEARTQEFVLSWSNNDRASVTELVRQQFNFAPGGATTEEENYVRPLAGVTDLVLTIIPDISGGPARATLTHWRMR